MEKKRDKANSGDNHSGQESETDPSIDNIKKGQENQGTLIGPLKDIKIETEIGGKHPGSSAQGTYAGVSDSFVFKERYKIENFVQEMSRKFMLEKLIFPNCISIPNAVHSLLENQAQAQQQQKLQQQRKAKNPPSL